MEAMQLQDVCDCGVFADLSTFAECRAVTLMDEWKLSNLRLRRRVEQPNAEAQLRRSSGVEAARLDGKVAGW